MPKAARRISRELLYFGKNGLAGNAKGQETFAYVKDIEEYIIESPCSSRKKEYYNLPANQSPKSRVVDGIIFF